jgi:hypothetical protein
LYFVYRDKKVVGGVFVRFSCAASLLPVWAGLSSTCIAGGRRNFLQSVRLLADAADSFA